MAIRKCIPIFAEDDRSLLMLFRCAFVLKNYETAAAFGEILLQGKTNPKARNKILAIHLAALAEMDQYLNVIDGYRDLWQPLNLPYPFPDRLLYIFRFHGAYEQESHLLETGVFTEATPLWAILSKRLHEEGGSMELVKQWARLYENEKQDERILVGFTMALLSMPGYRRGKWTGEIVGRWENLIGFERYAQMAGAFLVLLGQGNEERIFAFEKYLYHDGLSHHLARQAARAYIRALCRRKRWGELRNYLERPDAGFLRAVCPFEEYEFIRIMARLENLPDSGKEAETWGSYWERLVCLPMDNEMIVEAVDHFINLLIKLKEKGGARNGFFEDIRLQFLRRAKAGAESIIENSDMSPEEQDVYKARLCNASINGTHRILLELAEF